MHGLAELSCRGVRSKGEGEKPTCVVRLLQFLAVARTFAVPVAAFQMPLASVFMISTNFSLAEACAIICLLLLRLSFSGFDEKLEQAMIAHVASNWAIDN